MSLPIHYAAAEGDLAEVKRLVEEEGVNPEEPDPSWSNCTPLHCAAVYGRDDILTYLLETCGVDVDKVNNVDGNFTALYGASEHNHVDCIRLLLQHDADPNIANTIDGDTPLIMAAQRGLLPSLKELLQGGRCNLEIRRTDTGHTAILLAADQKKWDCVELLLSYNASPVAVDAVDDVDGNWNLHDFATHRQAPPHILQIIEAAVSEPDRARLLHRARRINEARHSPATDGPAFLRRRAEDDLPLPRVELSGPNAGGHEEDEEQTVRRAVAQYVVGMKEDGAVGGGMLKEHVVELMDMMLPVWDAERQEEEEEE